MDFMNRPKVIDLSKYSSKGKTFAELVMESLSYDKRGVKVYDIGDLLHAFMTKRPIIIYVPISEYAGFKITNVTKAGGTLPSGIEIIESIGFAGNIVSGSTLGSAEFGISVTGGGPDGTTGIFYSVVRGTAFTTDEIDTE